MDIQTIREVIRLRQLNHSMNAIAKRLTLSSSTVKRVIDRAKLLGLTWDEMKAINDDDLGALFRTPHDPNQSTSSEFDWVLIYQQSRGIKAKTLKELWTLHCSEQSLSYSAFCKRFKLFKKYLPVELTELSLTQNWDPGEVGKSYLEGPVFSLVGTKSLSWGLCIIFNQNLPHRDKLLPPLFNS